MVTLEMKYFVIKLDQPFSSEDLKTAIEFITADKNIVLGKDVAQALVTSFAK